MNNELNYNETNQELNIDSSESSISIEEETPSISFGNEDIELSFISEENEIGFESPYSVGGTKDHSQLENLDFESSGHTGFQPAGNYALKDDIPTNTSQLNNDSGFIDGYTETDPTVPQHVKKITKENIEQWNKGKTYIGGDNTVIEDNAINVYTNTGYKVSDKDIKLQSIIDSGMTGTNKIVYTDDEVMIIYDGTNKIRRSENGIDFEVITLPTECKYMVYNSSNNRLYGTNKSNSFIYSNDNGLTWQTIISTYANGLHQLDIGFGTGFRATYKSSKEVITFSFNEATNKLSINSSIKSVITPEFTAMVNMTQFVWCNSTGTFKYGAGTQEGNFASLSGISVNLLKRVNNITMLGLKNNNKVYLLKPDTSITKYAWIEYSLPTTCTVNDIIFNPYDETYYIFTNINTYYKTKDFVDYKTIDKDALRGIQGYFTLAGIQMTTSNHNELLLAPTRAKLENKAQEWDRALNKERWVGDGLEVDGEQIKVKGSASIRVNANGVFLGQLEDYHLQEYMIESIYVAKAKVIPNFDPFEMENWFWVDGFPSEENYKATKVIFNQAGSFYDQTTWETEYFVEQYEYGYIFADSQGSLFKYVKLGDLSWFFN